MRKSAILWVIFMMLAQVVTGLLWWWKWDTMTTALCWTLYGSIGFVLATATWCFFSPPWRTKFSDSTELFARMTAAEAEEEDEVELRWVLYFLCLLIWPCVFAVLDAVLVFAGVVFASKTIASIVRKAAGVEE